MAIHYSGVEYEKIDETVLRVYPFKNRPHIYVLIVPKRNYRERLAADYFLINEQRDNPIFMFGSSAETLDEVIYLADKNSIDYVPLNWLNKASEPPTLRICWRCLAGLEHREGPQMATEVHFDEDDENDSFLCDWCETDLEDTLFEIG